MFGRELFVARLVEHLRANKHFTVICGAAACGKTSLLNASLAMLASDQGWRRDHHSLVLRPGYDPWGVLARRLVSLEAHLGATALGANEREDRIREYCEELQESVSGLAGIVTRLGLGSESSSRLTLVIDQLEDIFRPDQMLYADGAEVQHFLDNIGYAVGAAGIQVVIAVQAEFVVDYLSVALAPSAPPRTWLELPKPSDRMLEEAIRRPARLLGYHVDPALVDVLVAEYRHHLRLLQFHLQALWRHRDDKNKILSLETLDGTVVGYDWLVEECERRLLQACDETGLDPSVLEQVLVDSLKFERRRAFDAAGGVRVVKRLLAAPNVGRASRDLAIRSLVEAGLMTVHSEECPSGPSQLPQLVEVSDESFVMLWPRLWASILRSISDPALKREMESSGPEGILTRRPPHPWRSDALVLGEDDILNVEDPHSRVNTHLVCAAPRSVRPKREFSARFVAFHPSVAKTARDALRNDDGSTNRRSAARKCQWRTGSTVEVTVGGHGLEAKPIVQSFKWDGCMQRLDFDVVVHANAPSVSRLHFDVAIDGVTIERMRLDLRVRRGIFSWFGSKKQALVERLSARTAFASYAREDFAAVSERVSALRISAGMDVFVDLYSAIPNEPWCLRIKEEIETRDAFLLFWSEHAAQSRSVEWEWRHALKKRGLDVIELHPLNTNCVRQLPGELAEKQAHDPLMSIRDSMRTGAGARGPAGDIGDA